MKRTAVALIVSMTLATPALARVSRCTVVALKPAEEVWTKGAFLGRGEELVVTQVHTNKSTGRVSFCGHGTGCYDSRWLEFRAPCRIITSDDAVSPDDDEIASDTE